MTVAFSDTQRAAAAAPVEKRLLVFSDDWGRHPSSCQHLISHLLPKYRVDWVNTIGMRRPSLNLATVRRGLEKCRDWTAPASAEEQQKLHENLNVVRPLMWPWFSRRWDRAINRRLLTPRIARSIESAKEPVTAVTTIPIVADLMDSLPVERWVYYCVDDFSQWPGLDQRAMQSMEETLVRRTDVLIAVSDTLRDRLNGMRPSAEVELLTHGVDLDHWRRSVPPPDVRLPTSNVERPLVVFWGLVDRRLDVPFLQALSGSMSSGTIAVVGPEDNPDPAIEQIPRLRRFPAIPYDHLPLLAGEADALIMPYADLPVTRAMQPLKLLEYLATDKPVIVRDLPATRPWNDCLDAAGSPQAFANLVKVRLAVGIPSDQLQSRHRVDEESWAAKAATFERMITC